MQTPSSPLKRLLAETAPLYWGRYLIALLFMAVVAGTTAALAWIMRDLINGLFSNKDITLSLLFAGGVFGIFLLRGIAGYFATTLLSTIGNAVVADLQKRMVESLLAQSLNFFQARASADLLQKLTLQALAAREVLQVIVLTLGRDLLTLIALLTVMVISDWKMLIAALIIMPVAVKGVDLLKKRVRALTGSEMDTLSDMTSLVQELSQGIRIVKSFALEGEMARRLGGAISAVQDRADVIAKLAARSSPILESVGGLAIAGAIVYGSWRVIALGESPGGFFAFIAALFLAYEPARRLARLSVDMEKGLSALSALYELIDEKPDLVEAHQAPALAVSQGTVRFDTVSFAYGEARVCEGLSFEAEGGKVTALVGPSGGGKSTLMALAQRFYDPDGGHVLIDGQDIASVSLTSLRQAMAYVPQETFLFQGTVYENIRLGRDGASRDEVIEAAKAAFAHDFIEGLPNGYDTRIGEFGTGLSGGQRQRLALARAFLKNAPIMLLDEATSALDSESERMVQQALETLTSGRTALIIAHRLSTVRRADRILVIDAGKVIECGSHDELVARGGRYAQDVAIQFGPDNSASQTPAG